MTPPAALAAVVLAVGLGASQARLGQQEGSPAAETAPSMTAAAVCAEALVAETCALLGGGGGSAAPADVAELLAATPKAVAGLWAAERLPEGEAVSCDALCRGTTALLERLGRRMPATSDTGCYDQGGDLVCDVDLSPPAIKEIAASSKDDFGFAKGLTELGVPGTGNESSKEGEAEEPRPFEYDLEDIAVRVAQLFRVYPALGRGVVIGDLPAAKGEDLKALLQRRMDQSMAFVNLAIRSFPAHGTRAEVAMYFGESATTAGAARRKVFSVLNSINNVLSYAHYVSPGQHCKSRALAYVVPCQNHELERDASGRYMVYLCGLFWSIPNEQISTLVHEASHHSTACTKDLVYGAQQCRALAQQRPRYALFNAANYGYYVREVAARRGTV